MLGLKTKELVNSSVNLTYTKILNINFSLKLEREKMKNKDNTSKMIRQILSFSRKSALCICALFIFCGFINAQTETKDVDGNWAGYFADGTKSAYIWAIRQTGSTLKIEDIGTSQGTKLSGQIVGDQITLRNLNVKGTLSADGREISWTDGVVWVRQLVKMASSDKSKQLPGTISKYLDNRFKDWEISPESQLCGEKALFDSGDFDGDGKTDYVVFFVTNKNRTNSRQFLYAFLNKGNYYQPFKISEDAEAGNFSSNSFAVNRKGETLQTGEGRDDVLILNVDAITEYTCETDGANTFLFSNGKFSALDLYQP